MKEKEKKTPCPDCEAADAEAKAEAEAKTEAEAAASEGEATTLARAAEAFAAVMAALPERERENLRACFARLAEAERERERAVRREQEDACLSEMAQSAAFPGILDRADDMRALIGRIGWLGALPVRDRFAAAFCLLRGMQHPEEKKEEEQDLLTRLLSDPALMRELSLRRHRALDGVRASLPPFSRRTGTANTPACAKHPPRTLKDATEEAKQFLLFSK